MAISTFKTNPVSLAELLKDGQSGELQLPDFQRSWVWDEDRIKSLIASISRSFPVGALMTLETGGTVDFKPRPIEGAPPVAEQTKPEALLLDGQQRITSLFQATLRKEVIKTRTVRGKTVYRWFYIDIHKALDHTIDREEAIVTVPEDKKIRSNFGKDVDLDLSSRHLEFENAMYPLAMIFQWGDWQQEWFAWGMHRSSDPGKPDFGRLDFDTMSRFKEQIVDAFEKYQLPVIALDKSSTKEAVCTVFEKVNTGGKPLDAFELITAMYAADGYELRKDWNGDKDTTGRHERLSSQIVVPGAKTGILSEVSSTDFLHVVSLFHTSEIRDRAIADGKSGRDLPQVIGNRGALLNLPLAAYEKYQHLAEEGFNRAAKFLYMLRIYRTFDLPYQSQIVPLAAILAKLGGLSDNSGIHKKIEQWYWNGVFGELYGSTTETRIARDFLEVPAWVQGGPEPTTIRDCSFRMDRLDTMRMRLSAAYKGVNALLMLKGAHDFRTGLAFDNTMFFGEVVDIHHIFPQKWCTDHSLDPNLFNSIVNKTPLSYKTNRAIGGDAPSIYLAKLERGDSDNPPISAFDINQYLQSHLINVDAIRSDDFEAFYAMRKAALAGLIAAAIAKPVISDETVASDEEGEATPEELHDQGIDEQDVYQAAD